MTKLVFLVLILSLGQYSHIENLDKSLKSVMLKQADFQTVDLPEIFGLEPNFPSTLGMVEQMAPIFAGAESNFFYQSGKIQGWHRQKEKLGGLMEMRKAIRPTTMNFSAAEIDRLNSKSSVLSLSSLTKRR